MRRMFQAPRSTHLTLNLAPMVDVMMCLIIFFLLGSSLASEESRPVQLAFASVSDSQNMRDAGGRVVVNVRRTGDAGEGQYVVVAWDGAQIGEQVLDGPQLDAHLATRAAAARRDNVPIRCVIRADRDVSYAYVERVLRACGLAQIGKVSIAASTEHDPGPPS